MDHLDTFLLFLAVAEEIPAPGWWGPVPCDQCGRDAVEVCEDGREFCDRHWLLHLEGCRICAHVAHEDAREDEVKDARWDR